MCDFAHIITHRFYCIRVKAFSSIAIEIRANHWFLAFVFFFFLAHIDKKLSGKSKDEQMAEKKQELEKRLQDVTGQLGSAKKAAKKGKHSLTPLLHPTICAEKYVQQFVLNAICLLFGFVYSWRCCRWKARYSCTTTWTFVIEFKFERFVVVKF